jgi:hypothetical protein
MPQWLEISTEILTLLIMLAGLAMMLVPILPAGTIIWLAAFGYGLAMGFNTAGVIFFVIITLLIIASMLIDNILMGAKAKQVGASWLSIAVSILAGFVVTLLAPPFGGLIAAPIALYFAEYLRLRDTDQALKATRAMIAGCGWAFFVRFGLGALAVLVWIIWAWGNFA